MAADDEVRELLEELSDHPGQRLVWQRDSLQRALQIYFHHTDRLEDLLLEFRSDVQSDGRGAITEDENDRFLICLHDYFSASYGVFSKAQDFQSRFYCDCTNENCSPDSCDEFEPYLSNLRESGLTEMGAYMNSLRVVVQKIRTPSLLTNTKYNFFDIDESDGVVIDRQLLLDWVRGSRDREAAIGYLEDRDDAYICLHSEVVEYRNANEEFYGWLFQDAKERYAHELRSRRTRLGELRDDVA
ncbi:hypothetical protein HZS55_03255 [Halosimplex rubrum]|uniref:Uncharacterized protein n=1 Tax=Halosimplex rubrum TaxID=869889 RepID=A0A7D5P7H9_9EURY|nr:hypothetical protein [Halosimplex rubrum]QLH76380.1 hypothetical protein HZS55_03255 [Halosimplex rubrum]